MSAQKPPQREFVIRVPKKNEDKRFSILKFNDSLSVDPANWHSSEVKMFREDNKREVMSGVTEQDYGEGSVYGRAAREEARRKKYGRRRKGYEHDNQPWHLTVTTDGKDRKLRSIREGGAGEFADYWVFLKAGDDFQAHKITDWYQFLPCVTHKTLDSEQAEEKFQLRNKVMNQFALKAQIMQQLKEQDDDRATALKASSLMIKDEQSSDDDDNEQEADEGLRKKKLKKKKRDPDAEKKRDKRQRVENADDVAAYESEDGQDEGREYDYMSDSGSESDRDEKTADQKVEEALVGVGDESGLKSLIGGSDLETTSDEENLENDEEPEEEKPPEKSNRNKRDKKKQNGEADLLNKTDGDGNGDKNSTDSDSDDPDSGNVRSVLFMQRKDIRKRPAEDGSVNTSANGSLQSSSSGSRNATNDQSMKRQKTDDIDMPSAPLAAHAAVEALDEDVVRRLLLRKPHTTKELLNKVKPRCGTMTKAEIVAKLAQILKKIEPYQFRQKSDNKEVLYFSLNQTA